MESFRNTLILVDTSAFMHDGAYDIFVKDNNKYFKGEMLIIPQSVVQEINKHVKSQAANDKVKRAERAVKVVKQLQSRNLAIIVGDSLKITHADQEILAAINTHRTSRDIAVITFDKALCRDVLDVTNQSSVKSRYSIRAFNPVGLGGNQYELKKFSLSNFNTRKKNQNASVIIPKFKLGMSSAIVSKKTMINNPSIPDNGVVVDSYGNYISLGKRLGGGGEGTVYKVNGKDFCVKIYKQNNLSSEQVDKLKLMISAGLKHPNICWPIDLVYDMASKKPVGLIIPEGKGDIAQTSICQPTKLRAGKSLGHLTRLDIVIVLRNLMESINFLHQNNIIIGDINLQNIMVDVQSRRAYLIDCDSYQVENYPCSVGVVNFTAPEVQGMNYGTFLRTMEHEKFAVATLAFMFLLPGKPPYAQQEGGYPQENIKKQEFPYRFGENYSGNDPEGPWRYMWSHLPHKVKEAFYNCFANNKRLSSLEWLDILRAYENDLTKGYLSSDIFPNSFKVPRNFNPVSVECSKCNINFEMPEKDSEQLAKKQKDIICPKCRRMSERLKKLNVSQDELDKAIVNTQSHTHTHTRPQTQQKTGFWGSLFNVF